MGSGDPSSGLHARMAGTHCGAVSVPGLFFKWQWPLGGAVWLGSERLPAMLLVSLVGPFCFHTSGLHRQHPHHPSGETDFSGLSSLSQLPVLDPSDITSPRSVMHKCVPTDPLLSAPLPHQTMPALLWAALSTKGYNPGLIRILPAQSAGQEYHCTQKSGVPWAGRRHRRRCC